MKFLRIIYSLALIALFAASCFAQSTPANLAPEEADCGTKASKILTQPQCKGIDLSSDGCTTAQMSKCFGGNNDAYNDYRCCTLDVSSKGGQTGKRKLNQMSSCFKLYTQYSIQYETSNLIDILKYCIKTGYKTNYSTIIGDESILQAIGEGTPAPSEASMDKAPKSSAATLGFGAIAVAILAFGLLL